MSRQYSTHNAQPRNTEVLHEGIPEWMTNSINEWLKMALTYKPVGTMRRSTDEGLIRKIERKLRKNLTDQTDDDRMLGVIFYYMDADPELKLDVAQAILELGEDTTFSGVLLDGILEESGSKWRVKIDRRGDTPTLEERVDNNVTKAFKDATKNTGKTADYLELSWSSAFGRNPDPSQAYSNAVKAIEAAAWRHVLPDNARATLGDIIRELEVNKSQWRVAINEKTDGLGVESIASQMKLIWQGQTDRHGTSSPVTPSQVAAEQSLICSIAVCQQFERGQISRII